MPHFESECPRDAVISSEGLSEEGNLRFCLDPLPAGSYRLKAWLATCKGKMVDKRWAGEVKGIRVELSEETSGVVVQVTRAEE